MEHFKLSFWGEKREEAIVMSSLHSDNFEDTTRKKDH